MNHTHSWILAFSTVAMTCQALAEDYPMTPENWDTRGSVEFMEFEGKDAAFLNNGLIILKNKTFKNGVIEFDIAFSEVRGFMGVNFRVKDAASYENFYFRSHQSGNPDANQYTPAFHRLTGWQIYYGPQYSTPIEYNFDTWQHVTVLVKDDAAEFYLDSDQPFLHVDDLLNENISGVVSFSSFFTGAYFANVQVTATDDIEFKGQPVPHDPLPENLVTSFEVGLGSVLASTVTPTEPLNPAVMADKTWVNLNVEKNGIANLARINGLEQMDSGEMDEKGNPIMVPVATTLVRVKVQSDADQIRVMKFGYSDKAFVFLNGQPVAGGDNTYMTRDYRYLGTVGLFDEVYLNLNEGENEIVFAVTEAFGGWAVMAQFPDMEGISIIN